MCSKKFPVVKSRSAAGEIFFGVVEPSVGDFLGCCLPIPSFSYAQKSFYSLLLYSDFATLKCMTWLSLPWCKSWLNEPRMLHYGPSEDTAK